MITKIMIKNIVYNTCVKACQLNPNQEFVFEIDFTQVITRHYGPVVNLKKISKIDNI